MKFKATKKKTSTPTRYFKAYLRETTTENGNTNSEVQCLFSKKPFTSEQFFSLIMGVLEAYAEQLLTTKTKEAVYDNLKHG